jgi:hypothetical protein
MLVLYNEALQKVATGQSYQINNRTLTRADIREIRDTIEWLEKRIAAASGTSGGIILASFEELT